VTNRVDDVGILQRQPNERTVEVDVGYVEQPHESEFDDDTSILTGPGTAVQRIGNPACGI